jgi:putative CocE/NonD family hydrolase
MRCADGVRLASRIWRPAEAGRWPVLLMRQPYGSALASTITYAHPRWYAERGFVVVVQDVRGRGDSEGVFRGFGQEAADGADAVRWARGLPESNGRLGTYGFSYQGLSQLLNAAEEPDGLPDCLAPAMCGLDERLDWASEGGAHWWALSLAWALQLAAQGARRRGDGQAWGDLRRCLEAGSFASEGLALLERHDPEGMGLGWLRSNPLDPREWTVHAVSPELLRRPLLLIGGWLDPHLRGVLRLWEQAMAVGGRPALQVGAWSHLNWTGGIDQEQLAFFQRHLLAGSSGGGDRAEPAATTPARPTAAGEIWLQDLTSAEWFAHPPAPAAKAHWRLASDGRAAVRRDEGRLLAEGERRGKGEGLDDGVEGAAGSVALVHDPWRPVPGLGGHLGGEAALLDRQELDGRTDVACFSTEPLAQPLRLLGRPALRLAVAADQPGFDLCAALSAVSADDGGARQLSTGVCRVVGPGALDRSERQVHLQPLAATLRAGERLRLSLAPAAWPQIAVNAGDGQLPRGGVSAHHREITLTLELEGALLSIEPLLGGPIDGRVGSVAAN